MYTYVITHIWEHGTEKVGPSDQKKMIRQLEFSCAINKSLKRQNENDPEMVLQCDVKSNTIMTLKNQAQFHCPCSCCTIFFTPSMPKITKRQNFIQHVLFFFGQNGQSEKNIPSCCHSNLNAGLKVRASAVPTHPSSNRGCHASPHL